jgi:hypothetical protein
MTDFRGTVIDPGDTVVYVGRQDMKATLNEGTVVTVHWGEPHGCHLTVRPTRSSNPIGQPTGKLVKLTVARKIVVIKKARRRAGA